MATLHGNRPAISTHTALAPGPAAFVRRTSTPATAARTKDGVQGGAAAVAPVGGGGVSVAVAEDAAPRGDAGGAAAGGRTGAEVRDGSLSGTVGEIKQGVRLILCSYINSPCRNDSAQRLQVVFSGRSREQQRFTL